MRQMYLTRTLSLKSRTGLSTSLRLGLALFGLLFTALPVSAQSTTLESLPQASQEEISRVCLPVQFREGAGAYRNCVQAELQLRSSGDENDMARLSFDDKYAVQQACAKAGGQSSSAYQSCVAGQISELNSISTPVFDEVSEDELYVVQQSCFDAQSKQGAASYRQCLNNEVQSLLAIPAADTSSLNMLNKNALQLRCSANASTASQYRQCIAVEFESIAGKAPTFLPVGTAAQVVRTSDIAPRVSAVNETVTKLAEQTNAPTAPAAIAQPEPQIKAETNSSAANTTMALPRNIVPQRADTSAESLQPAAQTNTSDTTISTTENTLRDATGDNLNVATEPLSNKTTNAETRVISKPELVKALEEQTRADAQGVELDNGSIAAANTTVVPTTEPASSDTPVNGAAGLWQKFLDTLASLDGIGWLIIAGVLALPALLLGLFSLVRRVKQPIDDSAHHASPTDTIVSGIETRMLRHEREADELFGEHEKPSSQRIEDRDHKPSFETQSPSDPEHDAVTRMAMKHERPVSSSQQIQSSEPARSTAQHEQSSSAVSNYAWQSAFGHWLTQQPASEQMELCTEFLIYWVAYGDERYQPELKRRLFTANDLTAHDQIKRWVLKQDVFAFSDVIGWLRSNASQTQLNQSIGLLMALLVTENSVTPVQNTLLRFMSDAFNMGKVELEQQFEKGFGHALPAMPRPDKTNWWMKQEAESVQRWNSRAQATRPEIDQMMARLGLSMGYNESQVIDAFRRAARRCHPDRFTELGARERALAEQRFIKFEEARDKLLGVSV